MSSVREALSESLTEGDVECCGGAGFISEVIGLLSRCNVRKSRENWCGEIEFPWLAPRDHGVARVSEGVALSDECVGI